MDLNEFEEAGTGPRYTGNYLLCFNEEASGKQVSDHLNNAAHIKMAALRDVEGAKPEDVINDGTGIYLEELGVGIVKGDEDQLRQLGMSTRGLYNPVEVMEKERIVYVLNDFTRDYLRGYRDAIVQLYDQYEKQIAIENALNEGTMQAVSGTWGLDITNVLKSKYTGKGVNVAVLDTGFYLEHPDFKNRKIEARSFVPLESVNDRHGHGTHCVGTALGSLKPAGSEPRYGIAHGANIYVGKVLANSGVGSDSYILNGIAWALQNKCRIISMSLGAATRPGEPYSLTYERVAQRALKKNALIIAAAGNESKRPGLVAPVGHPANCPSVMAVAAIDANLRVAAFSCGATGQQGGEINLAAPGVRVRSSWIVPALYNSISGTSMATPHVAGIAALLAEANPAASAEQLWQLLVNSTRKLNLPQADVGAGLVQAP